MIRNSLWRSLRGDDAADLGFSATGISRGPSNSVSNRSCSRHAMSLSGAGRGSALATAMDLSLVEAFTISSSNQIAARLAHALGEGQRRVEIMTRQAEM